MRTTVRKAFFVPSLLNEVSFDEDFDSIRYSFLTVVSIDYDAYWIWMCR